MVPSTATDQWPAVIEYFTSLQCPSSAIWESTFKARLEIVELTGPQVDEQYSDLANYLNKTYPNPSDGIIQFASALYKCGGPRIKKMLNNKGSPFNGKVKEDGKRDYKAEAINRLKALYPDDVHFGLPNENYTENSSALALGKYATEVKRCQQTRGLGAMLRGWQSGLPKAGGNQFLTQKIMDEFKARVDAAPQVETEEESQGGAAHVDDENADVTVVDGTDLADSRLTTTFNETHNLDILATVAQQSPHADDSIQVVDDDDEEEVNDDVIAEQPSPEIDSHRPRKQRRLDTAHNGDLESLNDGQKLNDDVVWRAMVAGCPPDMLVVDPLDRTNDNISPHPKTSTIAIPVCQGGHWILGLVDLENSRYEIYDSAEQGRDNSEIIKRLEDVGKQHTRGDEANDRAWQAKQVFSAQQSNDIDCGIYVIVNFFHRANNLPPPTKIDTKLWRSLLQHWLGSTTVTQDNLRAAIEIQPGIEARMQDIAQYVELLQSMRQHRDNALVLRDEFQESLDCFQQKCQPSTDTPEFSAYMESAIQKFQRRLSRLRIYTDQRADFDRGLKATLEVLNDEAEKCGRALEEAGRHRHQELVDDVQQTLVQVDAAFAAHKAAVEALREHASNY